jgi:hypothetical protein
MAHKNRDERGGFSLVYLEQKDLKPGEHASCWLLRQHSAASGSYDGGLLEAASCLIPYNSECNRTRGGRSEGHKLATYVGFGL